jgi:ribose-phosphate pyrophosphokinase
MKLLGNVEGKNCLILDDIFDTGGTAKKCAELLKMNGAEKIYGCFTHPVMSGTAPENLKALDKVYITDTIPLKLKTENISVISLADLFAQAIYRTRRGESLSILFD